MKLAIPNASIRAVTNLMLSMGTGEDAQQVPATAVQIKGDVEPKALEQLRAGLADKFFEPAAGGPRVPCIPELAALTWKTEYEGGTLVLDISELDDLDFDAGDELRFTNVDAKDIVFEPLANGMVSFKVNAIVRTDQDGRGRLAALLKHNVAATFSKLTQQPLAEPEGPQDDANPDQGKLDITPPITPLMPHPGADVGTKH